MTTATLLHIRHPSQVGKVRHHIRTLCGHFCGPMALHSPDNATCPKCVAISLVEPPDYAARVRALEDQGMTTSDAQACVDVDGDLKMRLEFVAVRDAASLLAEAIRRNQAEGWREDFTAAVKIMERYNVMR